MGEWPRTWGHTASGCISLGRSQAKKFIIRKKFLPLRVVTLSRAPSSVSLSCPWWDPLAWRQGIAPSIPCAVITRMLRKLIIKVPDESFPGMLTWSQDIFQSNLSYWRPSRDTFYRFSCILWWHEEQDDWQWRCEQMFISLQDLMVTKVDWFLFSDHQLTSHHMLSVHVLPHTLYTHIHQFF